MRHRAQVLPEVLDGFLLGVAELLDDQAVRVGAVWPLSLGRLDEHPDQELAGLYFRVVAVLQDRHLLHCRAGEPAPGRLTDLLVQVIKLGSVHVSLPGFRL